MLKHVSSACITSLMLAVLSTHYLTMHSSEEQIIWSCGAGNANRSYQVINLNRATPSFNLIIYDGPIFDRAKYLETVQITVDNVGNSKLTGKGTTSAGTTIKVEAFGGNIRFIVNEQEFGLATGRCNRNVELN